MRTIRFRDHVARELERASYKSQRRWLVLSTSVLAALTVAALLLVVVTHFAPWPALLLGALCVLSGTALGYYKWLYAQHATQRGQLRAGLTGQRILPELLSRLPDDYYLVSNLKLPDRADDIDHLLIGPNGIFALETKHHRGRIFFDNGEWYQAKVSRRGRPQPKIRMRDPTRQLKRNVDYLRTCINCTDRALSQRTGLWIEGAVIFTHPAVCLDLPPEAIGLLPFPVLRCRDLPTYIVEHVPRHAHSKAQVRQIVNLFGHLQSPYSDRQR